MKINVTAVGEPWKPNPEADPLYTINVEGMGEPQKTYDAALAAVGEHEAEKYTAKSGKDYWRSPKAFRGSTGKSFKADPEKMKQDHDLAVATNQSIQRQKAADIAAQLVMAGSRDDLRSTFDELMQMIALPWRPDAMSDPAPPTKPGLVKPPALQRAKDDDLPPVESYEGMQ